MSSKYFRPKYLKEGLFLILLGVFMLSLVLPAFSLEEECTGPKVEPVLGSSLVADYFDPSSIDGSGDSASLGNQDPKPEKLFSSEEFDTDCSTYGFLKLDADQNALESGEYTVGDFTVYVQNDEDTFSWSSNFPVVFVYAKGGNQGGNLYYYPDGETDDCGLTQSGDGDGWSHIVFYFCLDEPTTTTTTTTTTEEPTTTTTTEATTTTTTTEATTTTTTEAPTTTEPTQTTTTTAPVTEATTTRRGGTTATTTEPETITITTTAPPLTVPTTEEVTTEEVTTEVIIEVITEEDPPLQLPKTGATTGGLVALPALITLAGYAIAKKL